MAIFGSLADVQKHLKYNPKFEVAFEYLRSVMQAGSLHNVRLLSGEIGTFVKYELASGSYSLEQVYYSRPRADAFFEAHRSYIDVQLILRGEEVIEVVKRENLIIDMPYDSKRDLVKFLDSAKSSPLRLGPGDVAIFYPEDAHMPGLVADEKLIVYKTVVKVPVDD